MRQAWERTARIIGEEGVQTLAEKRVAVFGLGGVGGHACEALARAGVGALALFDNDVVEESNLNRQLVALHSTLGLPKTDVMARRILDINPDCRVESYPVFYLPDNADMFPLNGYDYVVDAIDTVSAKLALVERARAAGVPIISAMGTGNKLYPEKLRVMDIKETRVCPLARVMRKELKKRGIDTLTVVCSDEMPLRAAGAMQALPHGRPAPGSISFVPAAAGLMMAGAVVRALLGLVDAGD